MKHYDIYKQNNQRELEQSLSFSLFYQKDQIGFARVITDYATFAYLCDVLIAEHYQNQGYGKFLMKYIFEQETLKSVKWVLRTNDAHEFYEKFGFLKTHRPERYMEKNVQYEGIAK